MSAPTAYPLCWPDNLPRWRGSRETGQFKTTLAAAMRNVSDSLRLFGQNSGKPVSGVVISSNVTLGAERPDDPGVAIWFTWEGNQVCIAVDRYGTVAGNLQAIHHVLEARRTELRHGTLALVRATMKGFVALPAPKGWRETLGFTTEAEITKEGVERAYRNLAAQHHPDKPGGSLARMAEINEARDRALREFAL